MRKKNQKTLVDEINNKGITHVDAGWRKFKLIFGDEVRDREDPERVVWGYTDFDECEIDVDKTKSNDFIREVILHEITHIILDGVGLGDDMEKMPFTNEHLTTLVSRKLLLIFNLNKPLFEILLKSW